MTRKSKRELERELDDLNDIADSGEGNHGIVFAHELADGTYVIADGTPLEDIEYRVCFIFNRPKNGAPIH
jgi:hypothetical protein